MIIYDNVYMYIIVVGIIVIFIMSKMFLVIMFIISNFYYLIQLLYM